MAGSIDQIMSPADFAKLQDLNGGLASAVRVGPATAPDPNLFGAPGPVKYPDIKFTFKNGQSLTAHLDPNAGAGGAWAVTNSGTFDKATSASGAADKTLSIPDDAHPGQTIPVTASEYAAYYRNLATQATQQANQAKADALAQANAQKTAISGGRAFASTASASDPYILSIDPNTGQITQTPNSNYDPTIRSDARDQLTRQAALDQLSATQRDLQNQIALGTLTDQQARNAFQDQYETLTAGLQAGRDAVDAAQKSTVNAVGPNFGANFAAALRGVATGDPSQVHFGPSDMTYPMPDFAAISQKATAAAIAHLSPFAAQISGRAAPATPTVAPYTPPPAPAAPSVLQAAANSVVSSAGQQQAPPPGPPRIGPYQPGS